jgi:GGDEF domain-containing protein
MIRYRTAHLSIGITLRSPGSQESIEDLMRRADMAMYDVKRAGRNHWRVSTEETHDGCR